MADLEKTPRAESAPSANASIEGETTVLNERHIDHIDIGLELYQKSLQYDPEQLASDAIKVRRKLDWLVLPMLCGTYLISFLDKQTLNYSNAYGLQADTNMVGDQYSWVASGQYFGTMLGAYPANWALQRYPVGRLLGYMCFIWGIVCMLQAAVFNFGGFMAIRICMGFVEACVSPACVLLTMSLWTRDEQPYRSNFWIGTNGVASMIGALLAFGLGHATGLSVPNWKLIYLVVGAMTLGWAVVISIYLPDGPHNAKMLTEYERIVAVWRISKNKTGIKHSKLLPYQMKEALVDPKTYLVLFSGMALGILNGSVTTFMSTLIKGFGFDSLKTSLMQMPGGAFEVVWCFTFGYIGSLKNMMGASLLIGCVPGLVGLVGLLTIDNSKRYSLLACAWIQSGLGSPIVLNWQLAGVNVSGHSKRTVVQALQFTTFAAGNVIGPHLFFPMEAPRYRSALKGLLSCYCIAMVLQGIYMATSFMQNKRRDAKGHHAQTTEEAKEGFEDRTDWENKHFRYRL